MERIELEITGTAGQLQGFLDRLQVPIVAREEPEGALPRLLHRIQLAVMQADPNSEVMDWRHGAQMRLEAD